MRIGHGISCQAMTRASIALCSIATGACGQVSTKAARKARGRRARSNRVEGAKIRSEEHTSELQSLMRISYAVFCLKKKHNNNATKHMAHTYIQTNIEYST